MRLIFLGTSEIAVPALKALAASGHELALVVTRPDTKKGRGLALRPSAVKIAAKELRLKLYQPQNLNTLKSRQALEKLKPDLFIVIAYGLILPIELLKIPRLYCINLHPSLLPKYRGAAPVNWAIIEGERVTGVTVFRLNERMDAGDIILQKQVALSREDTAQELNKKLAQIGSGVLLQVLDSIAKNRVKFIRQNPCRASYAPRLKKEQGNIDWNKPAGELVNLIRGLIPWPGAFTFLGKTRIKIWQAHWVKENFPNKIPGEILPGELKSEIKVQAGKDCLVVDVLQPEGKRRMQASEFLSGHAVKSGQVLTNKQRL